MGIFRRARRSGYVYDPDPTLERLPLDEEDLKAIYRGGWRDIRVSEQNMAHFVSRVVATWHKQQAGLQSLSATVMQAQLTAQRRGRPSGLDPRDAVKYLSPEELEEVATGLIKSRMSQARRLLEGANVTRNRIESEATRLRLAAAEVLDSEEVPAHVKERFHHYLVTLPPTYPEISVPRVLLEDPEGPPLLTGRPQLPPPPSGQPPQAPLRSAGSAAPAWQQTYP